MKTWKDIYSMPFVKLDHYVQVFDQNNNHVFDFEEYMLEDICKKTLKVINGEEKNENGANCFYKKENQCIYATSLDEPIIDIRGYGYLTGAGGLRLKHEEAANIQDSLAEFILLQINPR